MPLLLDRAHTLLFMIKDMANNIMFPLILAVSVML